ncbi:hypothetical protein SOVF_145680 [Spinacia oleracea]|nr:hypothetical protein SOVF_145680 [Spinacia oleracea]
MKDDIDCYTSWILGLDFLRLHFLAVVPRAIASQSPPSSIASHRRQFQF